MVFFPLVLCLDVVGRLDRSGGIFVFFVFVQPIRSGLWETLPYKNSNDCPAGERFGGRPRVNNLPCKALKLLTLGK